jgi:hypothetical protein
MCLILPRRRAATFRLEPITPFFMAAFNVEHALAHCGF